MSYDVFLQRFLDGSPASFDAQTAERLLAPYVVSEDGFLELSFPDDGRADVYLSAVNGRSESMMINHFSGGDAVDMLARLAGSVDGVLLLPDGPTLLTSPEQHRHLPPELQTDTAVISSGPEIEAVLDAIR